MGADRAAAAAAPSIGPAAGGRSAQGRAGDFLYSVEWLSMASLAEASSRHTRRFKAIFMLGAIRVDGRRSSSALVRQAAAEGSDASPNRQLPSSTVRLHRPRRPVGRAASMPGKRLYGRKRHIVTDTNGLLLAVYVHPANVQDVHGAVPLAGALATPLPKASSTSSPIGFIAANSSLNALSHCGPWTIEIVERPPGVKGFQLLPQALGRRANLCVVRQMPTPRQRLRRLCRNRSSPATAAFPQLNPMQLERYLIRRTFAIR